MTSWNLEAVCGEWAVVCGEWGVVCGQWAVESRRRLS